MLDNCLQKLNDNHLRITPNRQVLLEVLHAAEAPLSPPAIVGKFHAHGRKANKTTVYRELECLASIGLVRRVIVSDRKQYFELTERGHHHHFVCRQCDRVEDVEIEDNLLLRQAKRLGEKLSFSIEQHAVEFYGTCHRCNHL